MLLCEADGESILYTGDFRGNGRKPYDWLLSELPKKVEDTLKLSETIKDFSEGEKRMFFWN